MDGVLVDFMSRVRAVDPTINEGVKDEILWPIVNAIPNFWENLKWLPDGQQLWDHIKGMDPVILSAPSRNDLRSPSGKLAWIHQHLGFDTHWVFTRASKKMLLARPDAVLIDDFDKNIKAWRKAGGIGILHKNTEDTLKQLNQVMILLGEKKP